jgi:hypothetical protein
MLLVDLAVNGLPLAAIFSQDQETDVNVKGSMSARDGRKGNCYEGIHIMLAAFLTQ